jgi:hypothetical protein
MPLAVGAAPPRIDVDLSRSRCEVGDPVEVAVTVTMEPGLHVSEPTLHRVLRDVVQPDAAVLTPRETTGDGAVRQTWRSVFVPFLTGDVDLPEIVVTWTSAEGATGEVRAPLGTLTVKSVLAMGITPSEPLPPHGPFSLPVLKPRWPYWAAAFAAVVLGAAWWAARRWRRRGQPSAARPRRVRPPHEVALERLDALATSDLAHEDGLRVFFYTMTDIVRVYFDREFGIDAPEMTSTELLESLRVGEFPVTLCETVERWVRASDLVKYARQRPREEHRERAVKMAKAIVVEAHQHRLGRGPEMAAEAA